MPSITLTLTDTPNGAVSIHSSFKPAVGNPCSAAQAHALDIIARTHKQWGMPTTATPPASALCACDLEPTMQEADTGRCMGCGHPITSGA